MKEVSWSIFKLFIQKKSLVLSYIEDEGVYLAWAYDGPFIMCCTLQKNGSLDTLDFETNYKK